MPSVALLKTCSFARGVRKQANEWTAGSMPAERQRAGLGDHVLLGDPALDEALGEALGGTGSGRSRGRGRRRARRGAARARPPRPAPRRRRPRAAAGARGRATGAAPASLAAQAPSRSPSRARQLGQRAAYWSGRGARVEGVERRARALGVGRHRSETPRALDACRRSAASAAGRARAARSSAAERGDVVAVAARHRPAERARPWPRGRRGRTPRATHVSDWILLWSTITVISPKPSLAAWPSDSQNWPSCSSPSPVITNTRRRSPAQARRARSPSPSRCPCRASRCWCARPARADVGVARQAAEPAQPVQQLEVELAHGGEHRVHGRRVVALRGEADVVVAQHLEVQPGEHVHAREKVVPMWPEPASMIAESALMRQASANAAARATGSSSARMRSSSPGAHVAQPIAALRRTSRPPSGCPGQQRRDARRRAARPARGPPGSRSRSPSSPSVKNGTTRSPGDLAVGHDPRPRDLERGVLHVAPRAATRSGASASAPRRAAAAAAASARRRAPTSCPGARARRTTRADRVRAVAGRSAPSALGSSRRGGTASSGAGSRRRRTRAAVERVPHPVDVRATSRRPSPPGAARHLGAVAARHLGDLLGVRGAPRRGRSAALARAGDRVGDQRMTGERRDVLARDAHGAGARAGSGRPRSALTPGRGRG